MNNQRTNSYGKLLVFFLVAVIMVLSFGFVADGLQNEKVPNENSGNTDRDDNSSLSGDADNENDSGKNEGSTDNEVYIPEYVSKLTGLEVTEQLASRAPVSIALSSSSALYGISSADILIEIPTENGESRFLFVTEDYKSLGKIGAVLPTRGYISSIADSLGTILISYGRDDGDTSGSKMHFDLSIYSGSHYTEYNSYVYTNGDLISHGIANSGIGSIISPTLMPFEFADFGTDCTAGKTSASTVILPYGQSTSTELIYSDSDKTYSLVKSGVAVHDRLNDKTPKFKNAFILFADSITHETKDGSHLTLHTGGSGDGYYICDGTAQKISWSCDDSGKMNFFSESGEVLIANRGSSYIGFVKSSLYNEVLIK